MIRTFITVCAVVAGQPTCIFVRYSRSVGRAVSNSGRVDQFDRHLDQQVTSPHIDAEVAASSTPPPYQAPRLLEEQSPVSGHTHPPAEHLPPAQPTELTVIAGAPVSDAQPAAPQSAWSKKPEDHENFTHASGSSQAKPNSTSGEPTQDWGQEVSGSEQHDAQSSQARPVTNSTQDWPASQQTQREPQRGNKITYGGGSVQYSRTGSRNAGKKNMASKGFVAPIQITRMGWGDPLPNAQDTWGDEELVPQPLASAMPAAGKPSKRRPAPTPPAFPPMPEVQHDVPVQQASRPARPVQPQPTVHWQRMWTTDALDHVGDEVRACLHVTKMPDLVDDNVGAGTALIHTHRFAQTVLQNLWHQTSSHHIFLSSRCTNARSFAYATNWTDCMGVCRLAHHHFYRPAQLVGMHLYRQSWGARFAACTCLGDRVPDI